MSVKDRPFEECVRQGVELIKMGHHVHQKFTCSACGARNHIEEPDIFHKTGTCGDCGHLTDIEKQGCGYALLMSIRGNPADELDKIRERLK